MVVTTLLALLLAVLRLLPTTAGDMATGGSPAWVDLALGLLGLLVLPFILSPGRTQTDWSPSPQRERRALALGMLTIVATALSSTATVPAALAFVSLAGRRRLAWVGLITGTVFATVVIALAIDPVDLDAPLWFAFLVVGLLMVIGVLLALYRGGRRELRRTRAETAQREQQARIEQARVAERTRIAREMHDTLSHRLSLITLHAGALEYRADLDRGAARQAARVIREAAGTAADELRTVLTVLREDAGDTRPGRTLSDIDDLVDRTRAAGVTIDLQVGPGLDPAGPQDQVSNHVYRVLQESLTNATKHAPGSPVTVRLDGAPGEGISLDVTNPLPDAPVLDAMGAGIGLVGLEERLHLADGTFRAGPDGDDFRVTAWLPWAGR